MSSVTPPAPVSSPQSSSSLGPRDLGRSNSSLIEPYFPGLPQNLGTPPPPQVSPVQKPPAPSRDLLTPSLPPEESLGGPGYLSMVHPTSQPRLCLFPPYTRWVTGLRDTGHRGPPSAGAPFLLEASPHLQPSAVRAEPHQAGGTSRGQSKRLFAAANQALS